MATEVGKSELDLFSLPPIQIAIQSGAYVSVSPKELTNEHRIKLSHIVSEGHYADLAKSYITFKVKIVGATETVNKVGPVNLWGHSVFEQLSVKLNGETLTENTTTYPYEAMIGTVLSYGTDAKNSHLGLAGYAKDIATKMDNFDPTENGCNPGLIIRSKSVSKGKTTELLIRPFTALFQQDRLIPSGMKIEITLIPSKSEFNLMALAEDDSGKYKTVISDMELHVRQVKLLPSVMASILTEREHRNILLPMKKLCTSPISIPVGTQSIDHPISEGPIPTRIYMIMVEEKARFGCYKLNPFNLQHFNLIDCKLQVNSTSVPTDSYKPNFKDDLYKECYFSMFSQMGCMFDDCGMDISYSDYKNGYTILAFDLTADLEDGDHRELRKMGDVRLRLKLAKSHITTIDILCIKEFDTVVEIDKHGKVFQ